ncbi:MAG: single-stranded DNA-binding protein [Oscillospiraceae bacterium]|nr:single-stranded DNA-binding protein [Oscillospiraceae bacterium]
MEPTINSAVFCGTMAEPPSFSHENHGRRFFRFVLDVPRLSGTSDLLPVLAAEDVLSQADVNDGDAIRVTGQLRSFNSRSENRRRLVLSVFASAVENCSAEPLNDVCLTGAICRTPVFRRTPLGREICDLMLAVSRRYHRTDYVPCILWGKAAQDAAQQPVGTRMELHGRLQSREYLKVLEDRSEQRVTYELSVTDAYLLPPGY